MCIRDSTHTHTHTHMGTGLHTYMLQTSRMDNNGGNIQELLLFITDKSKVYGDWAVQYCVQAGKEKTDAGFGQ